MSINSMRGEEFPPEWYAMADLNHFWIQWRMTAFLNQITELGVPLQASWRGLDIGCGHGVVRRQLELATHWTIDGADVSEAALRQNIAAKGATMLYSIHERKPELADRYDFLILFDVLEHVQDSASFLNCALYHLKPGGWLFLNVPALDILWSAYDVANGHWRRYTKTKLRKEFAPHPLRIKNIRYWGFSLVPLLLLRALALRGKRVKADTLREGFQPPAKWINRFLTRAMRIETGLIRRPPIGTSILAAAVKAS